MYNFKPNKLTLALVASGLVSISSVSSAAEEKIAEQDVEIIEVVGIRGSLQRAQAIKMSTNSIVEVLSAEDIGKLPDTSVAESLSRLPGLTGERRNGRTSGLSVRGFNENYVGTSLNGRELLGMGDNRGVEYDLYPSEIVSNIVVYKTPEAGITTQGIGGTVDLQTVSPLTQDTTFVINANYEQNANDSANPDYDNDGHKLSFNYVDKFLDDTLGVALVFATQETPRQEEQFRGWGYPTVGYASCDDNGDNCVMHKTADGTDISPDTYILGGHDSFARSALLERDSYAAIIEYAPTEDLKIKIDALYIDFEESDVRRGLEEGGPIWGGANWTATEVVDGLVTDGYWDGFHSVIRNDARTQESDLTTIGVNFEYNLNDYWTLEFDYSTGQVDKDIVDIESYSGTGRAKSGPAAARSWTMNSSGAFYGAHPTMASLDYTDESLIRLAGPQTWGNPVFGVDSQDGFVNRPKFEEELDSYRLQANGVLEFDVVKGIEVGVVYSDREKSKTNEGDYLTAPEYSIASELDGPIPNVIGNADIGFIGLGEILSYDSLALYNSGYYTAQEASQVQNDRFGDSYKVEEEQTILYAKLDLEYEFGDVFMSGNFGVQWINIDQKSSGFSVISDVDGNAIRTPVEGGDSYDDFLPTLNLSFEIAENQFIRTGLAKVMSRPRMDDMKPNNQVTFSFDPNAILNPDPQQGPWSGSAGNPGLRPLEAKQFDISYENYFSDAGYFATTFFYKDLTNWHRDANTLTDFSDVYIPELHQTPDGQAPATFNGFVDTKEDGLTGFVRGYEYQASIPLGDFVDPLQGFGLVMSATFLDGELDDGGRIPGLSEESYSLTAYYERNGFEFRISGTKRDEFLTESRGLSLALEEVEDLGSELWDAQIGYDFSASGIESLKGLRITLQAQNITDEETVQAEAIDSRQVKLYQSFGANYSLGLNYKF